MEFVQVVHDELGVTGTVPESGLKHLAPGWRRADQPKPTPTQQKTPEPDPVPAGTDNSDAGEDTGTNPEES